MFELHPILWEEFKQYFLGKLFSRERREVKVQEFNNLKKENISVEEYSLKFSMLYRYSPSLVSNLGDEMSRFVIGVTNLVKEECRTAMLHDDMMLSILILYDRSIEESKPGRIATNLKRSGSIDESQPSFNKKVSIKDESRGVKVKL